jgi:hypothetical protein
VWSDKGQVEIFDLKAALEAVHSSTAMAEFIKNQKETKPLFSFSGHMTEGFALDWSPKIPGTFFFPFPIIYLQFWITLVSIIKALQVIY